MPTKNIYIEADVYKKLKETSEKLEISVSKLINNTMREQLNIKKWKGLGLK